LVCDLVEILERHLALKGSREPGERDALILRTAMWPKARRRFGEIAQGEELGAAV
jgi:hypothetical protein